MSDTVTVGFLGCGTVGSAATRILLEHEEDLAARTGARLKVGRVAVRDLSKPRATPLPRSLFTTDPWEVVNDPSIDVVVEVIGGIEPALDLVLAAIKSGKHLVTANKELISTLGREVVEAAESSGVDVLFEAAVGGGVPIIRPMKESLAGDRVRRVMGIVNGTTNFILTRMSDTGESFGEALAEAERLGYTELDPSADIEGYDAAQKIAILASMAFGTRVVAGDVHREGITHVSAADIAAAHDLGFEVKLLGVAEIDDGEISARVHPAMIPRTHPLAAVRDVFNAIYVEAVEAGELMFFGRGAGGGPTGSAVVGDIVEIARNLRSGGRSPSPPLAATGGRLRAPAHTHVRYYVVLSVLDQPGVLSQVAGVFARHGVSIASVRQEGRGEEATLALITHVATEGQHAETFRELEGLASVRRIESRMRVMGTEEL